MTLFPNLHTETIDFGGKKLTLETGRLAKQASAAVLVTYGETMVLVTVTTTYQVRKGLDFFPLVVDVAEKTYAAGKMPGGFFKREGRPSEEATLNARQIDRPIRPLFPDGFNNEVQVIATVLSVDKENPTDFLGIIGASAALHISDIPWNGPIAGCFVGRIDGKLVVQPTLKEMESSDLELFVAAKKDGIVMVEGASKEVSEDDTIAAMQFAVEAMNPILALIERFREKSGKPKHAWTGAPKDEALTAKVKTLAFDKIKEAAFIKAKHERYAAYAKVKEDVMASLGEAGVGREEEIKGLVEDLKYTAVRHAIVEEGRRIDGRTSTQIRPIECQTGLLPRAHGSALFTRGETQALVAVTFGTKKDEQRIDSITGEYTSRFMLHYNFPPFSTGEVKPQRSPGPSRDRPRQPGAARCDAGAAGPRGLPLHAASRVGSARVQRLVVDGDGLRQLARADGCRCSAQEAGGGHRDGPDRRERQVRGALGHPRRRGSPGRHGLQGHRHDPGHHQPCRWTSRSSRSRWT